MHNRLVIIIMDITFYSAVDVLVVAVVGLANAVTIGFHTTILFYHVKIHIDTV